MKKATRKNEIAAFAFLTALFCAAKVCSKSHLTGCFQGLGKFQSCEQVRLAGHNVSGVYALFPDSLTISTPASRGIAVYCDLTTEGGGWTVIQRRVETDKENFYREWEDYENGFGRLDGSFWIGLRLISELTKRDELELYIKLTDWDDNVAFARYNTFKVGNWQDKYRLTVAGYSGNAGDGLSIHNGMAFTTRDRDNDNYGRNCAQIYNGAWWYYYCHQSNLNGLDLGPSHESYANGINWSPWKGFNYSLKRAEMKIRSRNFKSWN